ncbi:uncharacterized protein LOC111715889 [Eurytemora carolleeae]|uniref:uncharacterized protein LOC111715889 n=1 Tax=Eurytemora carolleeae TaxID=1294199 RepID=UPI000C759E16|nr:uncharacterized protein LOC111715889 [Eurytemora carolleeae]|eukprot:XP_023347057.1 uncharacterized protein LOC111715889 [Eurytemora affinis]
MLQFVQLSFLLLYTAVSGFTFFGDTRVNQLLQEKEQGRIVLLDPAAELVREDPPGSGRIVPVRVVESIEFLREAGRKQEQDEEEWQESVLNELQEDKDVSQEKEFEKQEIVYNILDSELEKTRPVQSPILVPIQTRNQNIYHRPIGAYNQVRPTALYRREGSRLVLIQ